MPSPTQRRLLPLGILAGSLTLAAGAISWLDIAPEVEPDFFFSDEDPQFQESAAIERSFPSSAQVILRASGTVRSEAYQQGLTNLSAELRQLDGVRSVRSILNTPALDDPLWKPLLISPGETASYLLAEVDEREARALVDPLSAIADRSFPGVTEVHVSGVPYVIALIERYLFRDLLVFSIAAFVMFGLAIAVVYRRPWIVAGALCTSLVSAILTLTVLQVLGLSLGLLTANLVTIVFILTLSHVVFLTSNWRLADENSPAPSFPVGRALGARVWRAITLTRVASFWCMATTSLGFLSLMLASARPLRDLGLAGATGTLVAIIVAFLVYPWFLLATAPPSVVAGTRRSDWLPRSNRWAYLPVLAVVIGAVGFGVTRLSTDPNLLTYFDAGGGIRSGLELIDTDGGSSPLRLVVQAERGQQLDRGAGARLVRAMHDSLLSDPAVGSVVSPALVLAEIARSPLAAGRPIEEVLDLPLAQAFLAPFYSGDRTRAHFMLRMHESGRVTPRRDIIERAESTLRRNGLEPVQTGGLFQLQAQLAELVASSLKVALAGLILLFAVIGWVLSRSLRTVAAMLLCLVAIPLVVLGGFGHAGLAIDIISSPAANVSLAMGVDTMIHLVVRARYLGGKGLTHDDAWSRARGELWHAIVGAGLIVGGGFAIFVLSTFPPTGRFGLAVVLGTVTAVIMALVALPMMAANLEASAVSREP